MKTSALLNVVLPLLVSASPIDIVKQLNARAPPGIPTAATASTQLAGLTVAAEGSQTGYSRDLFPHWITQSGSCNVREVVLARDGTNVVQDSDCAATSGSWYSPYDGATWRDAGDVDIDHLVPLSNAWKVCRVPYLRYVVLMITVGRRVLEHIPPPSVCKRPHESPTPCRHRQRQPGQG